MATKVHVGDDTQIFKMSFRKEEVQELVSEADHKLEILAFEDELAGRTLEKYAFDNKYIFKHPGYHDYFVNRDTVDKYNLAKSLYKDLERLREQRKYMQKQEELKLSTLEV